MAIEVLQQDYNIVKQNNIIKYIKLDILDFKYNIIDEISGNLIKCSITVDADSDLRRSCSVELVVNDSRFEVQAGGRIYLSNYIRPSVGYYNTHTGQIQWYNQGIFLINEPSWQYSADTNTLSFQGLDLMSKLTGVRNGQLSGLPVIIKAGESVREAMINVLSLTGFTKYVIADCKNRKGLVEPVPYDMEFGQGTTAYEILAELRDILPQYQIYFDKDGVFHYDEIPTGDDAPVIIDDTTWDKILISETVNTDFESVKNYIEVYGRQHDIEHFASDDLVSVNGTQITLTLSDVVALENGLLVGWKTAQDVVGDKITLLIAGLSAKDLVETDGEYVQKLAANTYYCAKFDGTHWVFLGHNQAEGTWYDADPDSPFYIYGSVGIIREVLSGEQYDNIMSDELALQRAKMEIYWKCRLNDSLSMSTIPIPWLDVNILVAHAQRNTEEEKKYLIKSFSADFGELTEMSINMVSYYPYYENLPWVYVDVQELVFVSGAEVTGTNLNITNTEKSSVQGVKLILEG